MHGTHVVAAQERDLEPLARIGATYPFHPYRRYAAFTPELSLRYLVGSARDALSEEPSRQWFAHVDGEARAAAILSPLVWESAYFGLRMGRLDLIAALSPGDAAAVADPLLDEATRAARDLGFRHLGARVDVQDVAATHALERRGFRLMDTLVTYAFDWTRDKLCEVRPRYHVRSYEEHDRDVVMEITARAFVDYHNRFTADRHLPKDRAQALYLEWARNCCAGLQAERMLIAERRKRVVGFLAGKGNAAVERHTGVRILGGGLGACYPMRFNAFLDLLQAAAMTLRPAGLLDCETHLSNVASIHFFSTLGFQYVRAVHRLHAWLGE